MTTVTKRITTEKNTWTFDVSMPPSGAAKILRVYGDVTDKDALNEAIDRLAEQVALVPSARRSAAA
jgi:phosphomannomutase